MLVGALLKDSGGVAIELAAKLWKQLCMLKTIQARNHHLGGRQAGFIITKPCTGNTIEDVQMEIW